MSRLEYDDICFIVTLLRQLDEQQAITLFCIFEQLLRDEKIKQCGEKK